ncbi:EAL domain-containing protein (plasmid) [Lichenicola cladoniae]|uniref:EAL domain-containing protein n=1 Tax=Lichenicola cladoniae TaxID=1484109 RepID=A0A6M8HYS8_9PROT|nr:EAL domain-containing protein [Acetobacteraceae bacterium]QKE93693.1 EAL domain-containing protein [Lichenicola cladoniae]
MSSGHSGTRGKWRCVTHAAVELCRSLGIITTAEGIKTPEQLAEIVRLGCNERRGYLLARPRSVADIPPLVESCPAPQLDGQP